MGKKFRKSLVVLLCITMAGSLICGMNIFLKNSGNQAMREDIELIILPYVISPLAFLPLLMGNYKFFIEGKVHLRLFDIFLFLLGIASVLGVADSLNIVKNDYELYSLIIFCSSIIASLILDFECKKAEYLEKEKPKEKMED